MRGALKRALRAAVWLSLCATLAGCSASRGDLGAVEAVPDLAERILSRNAEVRDATLAGRFIIEDRKGQRRGALRIRFLRPDTYRVDAFESGALGAAGATSFVVLGDSTVVYAEGAATETRRLGAERIFPLLRDFELRFSDLKALVFPSPYLDEMELGLAVAARSRGGYVLEGPGSGGNIFTVWIDRRKEAVTRALRIERGRAPVVEIALSRFEMVGGSWRPKRVEITHLKRNASLRVQYESISVNDGLARDDLLLEGMDS